MKLFTTFSALVLAALQIAYCSPVASSELRNETPANGQYIIEGCGNFRPAVEHLIDEALAAIPPVIRDADQYGTRSIYGFKAMFKVDEAVPLVKAMLQNIATLSPLPNLEPFPEYHKKPRFACATPQSVHQYPFLHHDPLIICSLGPVAGLYVAGTAYIFICPTFWSIPSHPEEPPHAKSCPVVRNNAFKVYPGFKVYHYQTYIILHELVHFYLQYESLSGLSLPPEQYSMNGCVALNPMTSLLNPLNLQNYVAMVQQGCVQSPDPDLPPWAPEALTDGGSLPHLNTSSPSGFSLSQANLSSSSPFTMRPLNLPPSSGAIISTANAQGSAGSIATL